MDLKSIKKQDKMIFGMANLSGSHHELKKIKMIRTKASKKHGYYSSDRYSSDYDYSLSSDSELDKIIQPT